MTNQGIGNQGSGDEGRQAVARMRAGEHDDMAAEFGHDDAAPGEQEGGPHGIAAGIRNYLIGLVLAAALTAGSFWVASGTGLLYTPGVPMALAALAVAQMGVHLAFFLHITTGPDNVNNALALAFGVLIVGIVIAGSLWIMYHLNTNMMLPADMMNLQMQR